MTSGGVKVPGPSAAERALQQQQAALLRMQQDILVRQEREQRVLNPLLLEAAGIQAEFGPEGELISAQRAEDPLAERRREIEEGFLERTEAALAGELPVNPALLRDLGEQEATLRERLRQQLGPGFETSTPGIEALGEFGQRREELLEGARRGDLTLGEQLSLARQQAQEATLSNFLNRGHRS